jgi:hypothetical protein
MIVGDIDAIQQSWLQQLQVWVPGMIYLLKYPDTVPIYRWQRCRQQSWHIVELKLTLLFINLTRSAIHHRPPRNDS